MPSHPRLLTFTPTYSIMAKKKTTKKTVKKATPKKKSAKSAGTSRGFKEMKLVVIPRGKGFVAALKYNGKPVFCSDEMSSEGHAKNFALRLADWLKSPKWVDGVGE